MMRRTLFTLITAVSTIGGTCSVHGQEVIHEVISYPTFTSTPIIGTPVVPHYESIPSGQAITIISERTLPAVDPLPNEVNTETSTGVVAKEAEDKPCQCLMPGGKIWEKLLAQELENARLIAEIELEKAKFELFRDQIGDRNSRDAKDLERRMRESELRQRELAETLEKERKEFDAQRREMERHIGELHEQLEVSRRENEQVEGLRRELQGAIERQEKMAREREELAINREKLERAMADKVERAAEKALDVEREWQKRGEIAKKEMAALIEKLKKSEAMLDATRQELEEARKNQEKGEAGKKGPDRKKRQDV